MRRPGFGETNFGSLAGVAVGSVGGLFALGIVRAIAKHNPALLIDTPILSLLSCLVCGTIGWFMGGQIGPMIGEKFRTQRAEIIGGAIGGLIPVLLVAAWGCYMMSQG